MFGVGGPKLNTFEHVHRGPGPCTDGEGPKLNTFEHVHRGPGPCTDGGAQGWGPVQKGAGPGPCTGTPPRD